DALLDYEANQNSGNGKGNRNDNGNGSHDSGDGSRRPLHTARGCTYKEFLNCQPLNFKGTEGAVGLAHWFEKMEFVFHISNCTVECQVKYATCTLLGGALTCWNSHVRTVGHDAAYEMPWKTLIKKMTKTYCPRSEVKKLEIELWNLKVKARPKMLQEAIELANDLMDQKVRAYADRQAKNKRRMDNYSRDNNAQQPPYKRQNVARAYSAGPSEKKESPTAENNQRTLTCFECGNQGHYHNECPKLKNQNRGNQVGSSEVHGRVYALGGGGADQSPINVEDEADAYERFSRLA
ncbi:reverse transcriptase domain-containing protein, partial [Tanacetum coccineum]